MSRTDKVSTFALVLVVCAAVAVSAYYELRLWNECRAEHSALYCWRVLGK